MRSQLWVVAVTPDLFWNPWGLFDDDDTDFTY